MSIKNDNEEELETAVNDTMNQNGWLIIQNLHLASKAMLKNLFKILKYAAKMQGKIKLAGFLLLSFFLINQPCLAVSVSDFFIARKNKAEIQADVNVYIYKEKIKKTV